MEQPTKYFAQQRRRHGRRCSTRCAPAGVDQIVFSSSCSVYGTPESVPVDERAPIRPESVYAETKAIVERMLHWYGEMHGLRSVSLRYFNAAGASFDGRHRRGLDLRAQPGAAGDEGALLGDDPPLQVFGDDYPTPDGTCIRDYIHVDDLADAHVKALDYLAGGGATTALNVGTGVGSSVLEVHRRHRADRRASGAARDRRPPGRRPGRDLRRPDAAARRCSAGGRRTDLDDIIASAWAWHHAHPDGYRDAR